jgi:hypothetical protein
MDFVLTANKMRKENVRWAVNPAVNPLSPADIPSRHYANNPKVRSVAKGALLRGRTTMQRKINFDR